MKRLFPILASSLFAFSATAQDSAKDSADAKNPAPAEEAESEGEKKEDSENKKEKEKSDSPAHPHLPPSTPAITEGTVTIAGAEIPFTATAGTVTLKDEEKGEPSAHVFHVSYVKKDVEDSSTRPVTFCFNGGPGSSAVWLHLGGLGPKKVELPADGISAPKPPGRLVENPLSILDATDLVFVDPVSTGFSRPEKPDGGGQFHGVNEDVDSMGEFIRLWITENRRWNSPKFLLGESYGGLRVAALSSHLQDRFGIYLNGTVLVSAVVDFATLSAQPGNDLPYLGYLPTLAATAHFHGVLKADAGDFTTLRKNVEAFVRDEYAPALLLGSDLPEDRKRQLAAKIASFTGLDPDYIFRSNLRISTGAFFKELLRSQGKIIGRFDGRVLGDDTLDSGDHASYDPSYSNIYGAFSSAMKSYLREDLKFESDLNYEILSSKVRPWDNSPYEGRYVNVAPNLSDAMQKNPHLHVLALCGYYDLATPYHAMEHTFRHLPIDPDLRKNLSIRYYESGHMMYNNAPDLKKMRTDLLEFIEKAK